MAIAKPTLKLAHAPAKWFSATAITGPTGAGKSITAAIMGYVLAEGNPFVVLTSEKNAPWLYQKRYGYDVVELESSHPDYMYEIFKLAEENYGTIIVDSLSSEWIAKDGVLAQIDKIKSADPNNKRMTQTAWGKMTPVHVKYVEAVTMSKANVIATVRVRSKKLSTTETVNGVPVTSIKTTIGREYQRDGFLDEFLTVISIADGKATVRKNRAQPNGEMKVNIGGREISVGTKGEVDKNCPRIDDTAWTYDSKDVPKSEKSVFEFAGRYSTWLKSLSAQPESSMAT